MASSGFLRTALNLRLISGQAAWQEDRRRFVRWALLVTAVLFSAGLFFAWWSGVLPQVPELTLWASVAAALLLWLLVVLGAVVPYALQAVVFLFGLWLLALQNLLQTGFVGHSVVTLFLFVIMTFALFDLREALVALAAAVLTLSVVGWLIASGRFVLGAQLEVGIVATPSVPLVVLRFGGVAVLLMLLGARVVTSTRRALREQQELTARRSRERQQMARQVADRTRTLRVAAQISRLLSTAQDRRRMQLALVDLIQEAYDYYHVELYRLAEDGAHLRLVAATGTSGKVMVAQQVTVPLGSGIAGEAAATATAVLQPVVAQSRTWRPNPLLPETRAETAVPVFVDGALWGVIDVQRRRAGSLGDRDTAFLESVARQLGIALRNINRLESTRQRADRELLLQQIGEQIQLAPDADALLKVVSRELAVGLQPGRVIVSADVAMAGKAPEVPDA